jgi:hypothetical protein
VLLAQRLRHMGPDTLAASLWALGRFSQLGLGPQLAAALAATPAVADDEGASSDGGSGGGRSGSDASAAGPPPSAAERQRPPRRRAPLTGALGARALALAPSMTGRQLATSLWGLARVGFAPPAAWLEAWEATAGAALREPGRFTLADCSVLLHAFALLRRPPALDCFAAWQSACLESGLATALPHALGTMLWSAGALGLRPGPDWMAVAFEASGPRLGSYDSLDLANAACGVAALGVAPPEGWVRGLAAAIERGVSACEEGGEGSGSSSGSGSSDGGGGGGGGGGGSQVSSGGRGGRDVGHDGGDGHGSGAGPRPVTPYAFSTALASLAKLGAGPRLGSAWLAGALGRSGGALGAFRASDLASTAWALARLDHAPPDAWMAAFMGACRQRMGEFSGHQLVNVIWWVGPRATS